MNLIARMRAWRAALAATLLCTLSAAALAGVDAEALKKLASDDFDEKGAAIEAIAANPDARTLPVLKALADGQLLVDGQGGGWIKTDTEVLDALTGTPAKLPDPAPDEVSINNMLRGQIDAALAALKLFAPERDVRPAAARSLQGGEDEALRDTLKGAHDKEGDADVREAIALALAAIDVRSDDPKLRLDAVRTLASSERAEMRTLLAAMVERKAD